MSLPYKRNREQLQSDRSPILKLQRVNYKPEEIGTFSNAGEMLSQKIDFENEYYYETSQNDHHSYNGDVIAEYNDEINFVN